MARARMNGDPPQRLVTWALATFHATLFVVASVLFAYTRGGLGSLLANLNTLVGLGLFAALWATTFLTTQRALEGIDVLGTMDDRAFVRRVFRWGAANGMAFLAVLAVVFLVEALAVADDHDGPRPGPAVVDGGRPRGIGRPRDVLHVGLDHHDVLRKHLARRCIEGLRAAGGAVIGASCRIELIPHAFGVRDRQRRAVGRRGLRIAVLERTDIDRLFCRAARSLTELARRGVCV